MADAKKIDLMSMFIMMPQPHHRSRLVGSKITSVSGGYYFVGLLISTDWQSARPLLSCRFRPFE